MVIALHSRGGYYATTQILQQYGRSYLPKHSHSLPGFVQWRHFRFLCALGCFIVVWWIGEVEESCTNIVFLVPFAEETRLNKFQPNPNRFRGPAS